MIFKLENETPSAYSVARLRSDNPSTSFPATIPDELLASFGVYRAAVAEQPVVDAGEIAERDALPTEADGSWVLGWTVRAKTAEEQAAEQTERAAAVNVERDRRLYEGTTVAVTGYGDVQLQGRPADQTNLIALEVTAMQLVAAGLDVPMDFRDAVNTMHLLTPAQMLELAQKGKQAAGAFYHAAWALKDSPPIPADFADDQHWP
jgi:hypothetical protein